MCQPAITLHLYNKLAVSSFHFHIQNVFGWILHLLSLFISLSFSLRFQHSLSNTLSLTGLPLSIILLPRPQYYKIIEECVAQVVLHRSGMDPDFGYRERLDVDLTLLIGRFSSASPYPRVIISRIVSARRPSSNYCISFDIFNSPPPPPRSPVYILFSYSNWKSYIKIVFLCGD